MFPRAASSILLLAPLGACSLVSIPQRTDCEQDAQCSEAFGPGSVCTDSGVCSSPTGVEQLQVGMLYIGPVGDHGWTLTHDESRAYFLQHLDGVSAMFAPSVDPPDAPERFDQFVERGDNVIIATSFDFLVPIQSAALKYPDVEFLLVNGFHTGPNLGSYSGRMYQALYQAGYLAGKMTTSGVVGVVGSVPIPETVSHTNAFTRGIQAANPDAVVKIRWVDAWFDPPTETAATEELLAAGADVILGQTDTTIPIETADAASTADAPIYTIGYDNRDSCKFAPNTCLTSAYWNWGPLLTDVLGQIQAGTWDAQSYVWEPMHADPAQSPVYLSEIDDALVPSAVRIEVEGLVDDLSEGDAEASMLPFRGPVLDNAGTTRFAAGELPADKDLLEMCWFVDGVLELDDTPAVVPTSCPGRR